MKLLQRAFWTVLILGIAYAVLFPNYIGCGEAWVTVHVHSLDAGTRQPIPAATVTLISERRTKIPEMTVSPPTILSAESDNEGRANVKDRFGAGFDRGGTSIYVGNASIRCEAAGYLSGEARVSASSRLRFRDFFFYKQPRTVEVFVPLARQ